MGLSEFTFRLALLFIPGIISFIIIDNLTIHKETKIHHWVIYSLLLGFLAYSVLELLGLFLRSICLFLNIAFYSYSYQLDTTSVFVMDIISPSTSIDYWHIVLASGIASLMGVKITKMINSRAFFYYANKKKISNKFSDLDAWGNFTRRYKPEWVRIRDAENDRCYQGILVSSSDATDRDGIILGHVDVYKNQTGEFLYSTKALYLPRKMECLIIELTEESSVSIQKTEEILLKNG